MSEQTEPQAGDPPAGDAQGVDPGAAINRGKGLSLDAVAEGSPAEKALGEFRDLVGRYHAAEAEFEALKEERNASVYALKTDYNVGFSAMAEIMGTTSSLVLYVYERAQGKTAKQIREESVASRIAKEASRGPVDPNKAPARRQTPEEKQFRKQQRDALRAFLEEQKRLAAERGDDTSELDAGLADADAEQAADDADV